MTRLQGNASNRLPLILGTLIAAVLIGLTVWAVTRNQTASGAASTTVHNFNLAGQPFIGKEDAPISIVAFEDFKCPNCKNFMENVVPTIQQKYIDTGKAKMYILNWPFLAAKANLSPDDSVLAAQAAECAYDQTGNAGFENMSTIIFRAQGPEDQVWATKDKLVELAGSVEGVDPAKLGQCIDAGTTKARVDADKKQGDDAGVNGTPSVYVNGLFVPNFSADEIGKAIDAASTAK
jgi:protein-disulfide isomerase